MNIAHLRQDYSLRSLDITDVSPNPFEQFGLWFDDAVACKFQEPNAMTLATASNSGKPSARIVLLKGFDKEGFVFFTNYNSHKGQELFENPYAALVFAWLEGLQRQVRIEGSIEKVSPEASTEYFQSRPKSSQIGAWVSPQSQVIQNREFLEKRYLEIEQQYQDVEVLPKPEHWGGYILRPEKIEFWQGRTSRLHDRICYTLQVDNSWKIERLAP